MSVNIGSRVSTPTHPKSEPAHGHVVDIRRDNNRWRAQEDRYVIQPEGTAGTDYQIDLIRDQIQETS